MTGRGAGEQLGETQRLLHATQIELRKAQVKYGREVEEVRAAAAEAAEQAAEESAALANALMDAEARLVGYEQTQLAMDEEMARLRVERDAAVARASDAVGAAAERDQLQEVVTRLREANLSLVSNRKVSHAEEPADRATRAEEAAASLRDSLSAAQSSMVSTAENLLGQVSRLSSECDVLRTHVDEVEAERDALKHSLAESEFKWSATQHAMLALREQISLTSTVSDASVGGSPARAAMIAQAQLADARLRIDELGNELVDARATIAQLEAAEPAEPHALSDLEFELEATRAELAVVRGRAERLASESSFELRSPSPPALPSPLQPLENESDEPLPSYHALAQLSYSPNSVPEIEPDSSQLLSGLVAEVAALRLENENMLLELESSRSEITVLREAARHHARLVAAHGELVARHNAVLTSSQQSATIAALTAELESTKAAYADAIAAKLSQQLELATTSARLLELEQQQFKVAAALGVVGLAGYLAVTRGLAMLATSAISRSLGASGTFSVRSLGLAYAHDLALARPASGIAMTLASCSISTNFVNYLSSWGHAHALVVSIAGIHVDLDLATRLAQHVARKGEVHLAVDDGRAAPPYALGRYERLALRMLLPLFPHTVVELVEATAVVSLPLSARALVSLDSLQLSLARGEKDGDFAFRLSARGLDMDLESPAGSLFRDTMDRPMVQGESLTASLLFSWSSPPLHAGPVPLTDILPSIEACDVSCGALGVASCPAALQLQAALVGALLPSRSAGPSSQSLARVEHARGVVVRQLSLPVHVAVRIDEFTATLFTPRRAAFACTFSQITGEASLWPGAELGALPQASLALTCTGPLVSHPDALAPLDVHALSLNVTTRWSRSDALLRLASVHAEMEARRVHATLWPTALAWIVPLLGLLPTPPPPPAAGEPVSLGLPFKLSAKARLTDASVLLLAADAQPGFPLGIPLVLVRASAVGCNISLAPQTRTRTTASINGLVGERFEAPPDAPQLFKARPWLTLASATCVVSHRTPDAVPVVGLKIAEVSASLHAPASAALLAVLNEHGPELARLAAAIPRRVAPAGAVPPSPRSPAPQLELALDLEAVELALGPRYTLAIVACGLSSTSWETLAVTAGGILVKRATSAVDLPMVELASLRLELRRARSVTALVAGALRVEATLDGVGGTLRVADVVPVARTVVELRDCVAPWINAVAAPSTHRRTSPTHSPLTLGLHVADTALAFEITSPSPVVTLCVAALDIDTAGSSAVQVGGMQLELDGCEVATLDTGVVSFSTDIPSSLYAFPPVARSTSLLADAALDVRFGLSVALGSASVTVPAEAHLGNAIEHFSRAYRWIRPMVFDVMGAITSGEPFHLDLQQYLTHELPICTPEPETGTAGDGKVDTDADERLEPLVPPALLAQSGGRPSKLPALTVRAQSAPTLKLPSPSVETSPSLSPTSIVSGESEPTLLPSPDVSPIRGVASAAQVAIFSLVADEVRLRVADSEFEARLAHNARHGQSENEQRILRERMILDRLDQLAAAGVAPPPEVIDELWARAAAKDSELYISRYEPVHQPGYAAPLLDVQLGSVQASVLTEIALFSTGGAELPAAFEPAAVWKTAAELARRKVINTSAALALTVGGEVFLAADSVEATVRGGALPLAASRMFKVWGPWMLAQHEPVASAVYTVSAPVWDDANGGREVLASVQRSLMPLHIFHALSISARGLEVSHGPAFDPLLAAISVAAGRVSSELSLPHTASRPLVWYDKLRLMMHGKLSIGVDEAFVVKLSASPELSVASEYLQLRAEGAQVSVSGGEIEVCLMRAHVTMHSDKRWDDRAAGKAKPVEILSAPQLKLCAQLAWVVPAGSSEALSLLTAPLAVGEARAAPLPLSQTDPLASVTSSGVDIELTLSFTAEAGSDAQWWMVVDLSKVQFLLDWYTTATTSGLSVPIGEGAVFGRARGKRARLSEHVRVLVLSVDVVQVLLQVWDDDTRQRGLIVRASRVMAGAHLELVSSGASNSLGATSVLAYLAHGALARLEELTVHIFTLAGLETFLSLYALGASSPALLASSGDSYKGDFLLSAPSVHYVHGRTFTAAAAVMTRHVGNGAVRFGDKVVVCGDGSEEPVLELDDEDREVHNYVLHQPKLLWTEEARNCVYLWAAQYRNLRETNASAGSGNVLVGSAPSSGGRACTPAPPPVSQRNVHAAREAAAAAGAAASPLLSLFDAAGEARVAAVSEGAPGSEGGPAGTGASPSGDGRVRLFGDIPVVVEYSVTCVEPQINFVAMSEGVRGSMVLTASTIVSTCETFHRSAVVEVGAHVKQNMTCLTTEFEHMEWHVDLLDGESLTLEAAWVGEGEGTRRAPVAVMGPAPMTLAYRWYEQPALASKVGDVTAYDVIFDELPLVLDPQQYAVVSDVIVQLLLGYTPQELEERDEVTAMVLRSRLQADDLASLDSLRARKAKLATEVRNISDLLRANTASELYDEQELALWRSALEAKKAKLVAAKRELALSTKSARVLATQGVPLLKVDYRARELSWELVLEGRTVSRIVLEGITGSILTNDDRSGLHTMHTVDISISNEDEATALPVVLQRQAGADSLSGNMLRVYSRYGKPVGGIDVYEHYEINVAPLSIALTSAMYNALVAYFWPEAASGPAPTAESVAKDGSGSEGSSSEGPENRSGERGAERDWAPEHARGRSFGGSRYAAASISKQVTVLSPRAGGGEGEGEASGAGAGGGGGGGGSDDGEAAASEALDDKDRVKLAVLGHGSSGSAMLQRAKLFQTFNYVKISPTSLDVTYKVEEGSSSVKDLNDVHVKLGEITVQGVTYSWDELYQEVEKQILGFIRSQIFKILLKKKKASTSMFSKDEALLAESAKAMGASKSRRSWLPKVLSFRRGSRGRDGDDDNEMSADEVVVSKQAERQLEVAKVRKLFGSRGDSDHQHAQLLLGTRSSGLDVAERVMLKRQQSRAAESGEDDAGSAGTSSPQSPVVPDQVDARERAREKAREKAAARIAAAEARRRSRSGQLP
ncbi:uncharacterized protein AMSG_12244 [Thecamonas trahens ATCC 50062]|uniref:FMP27/BLTP2/Hobbit GFWDK motif-containing RBG unit domain-containing protein n=1 Tax=Thecamonas trahens ATCC 50062 TaxID=461836 RepID=A0A0L0DM97_THETB|nr:hypothetical protein AMSG_12244 [Thecamonas trahens ATCC 50062]KNC53136.1 hypothetical protein AMSG_12244 [Thecamonas trahens ATCC 50062]|eukprot:XP_013754698.1 hypothetical protein AMSG_12244 [Thecamonas trahens ATCC 50062]